MSREKQIIKEIAKDLCQNTMCSLDEWNACSLFEGVYCVRCLNLAERLYNSGYRKQSEAVWVRQKGRPEAICSNCGREVIYQVIDNKWAFENFCPHCGAKMEGGAE